MANKQHLELVTLIKERADNLAELILKGINATGEYTRPSTVTLSIKIARDQDDPRYIEILAQDKLTAPKSKYSDLKSWDDVERLQRLKVGEDPGQEALPGTYRNELVKAVSKLNNDLKKKGASMTIKTPDGRSATIGKKD